MRKTVILLFVFHCVQIFSQGELTLSLEECIRLANQQSLDAFLTKNTYLVQYWNFRSYKASKLPSLHFVSTPINFYKGISQEWDSYNKRYNSYETERLNMDGALKVKQKIALTGGTLSLETKSSLLDNYSSSTYTSTPLNISFTQSLNGFNTYKWQKKSNPKNTTSQNRLT